MAKMSIYEKLQTARCELQDTNLKKSGWNSYSKYKYFELADFLPTINRIFLKYHLLAIVSFSKEIATMTIIDYDAPESDKLTFTSPMAGAKLTAAHEIQNLGAVETYQRRYLYMMALEIVESDALDRLMPEPEQEEPKGQRRQPRKAAKQEVADKVQATADRIAHRNPGLSDINRTVLKDRVIALRKVMPGQDTDAMIEQVIGMKLADVTDDNVNDALACIEVLMKEQK